MLSILREATHWLERRGIDWWAGGFPTDRITASVEAGDVYLLFEGDEAVATITVDFWPDPEFWGHPPDDAGYAHRLAVRRSAAGRGYGALLLDWAGHVVLSAGRPWLRLDANKDNRRLCRYYLDLGFRHVGDVDLPHRKSGTLFERPARMLVDYGTTSAS